MNKFAELINSDRPVLVDFSAEWCGPCKMMKPILEDLKKIVGDNAQIYKVDVDKHPNVSSSYNIQSVPTLILFKDGKPVFRQSGIMTATQLKTVIDQYK